MTVKYKLTAQALRLEESYNIDFAPRQANEGDAGFDLSLCFEAEKITILAGETLKLGTGICIYLGSSAELAQLTKNFSGITFGGFLMPRSSIKGLVLTNAIGLCDREYQGEVILSLFNNTDEPIDVTRGQRAIQYVVVPVITPIYERVTDFVPSIRGTQGFGSSGA